MARMRAARISSRYLGKVRSKTVSFPRNQGRNMRHDHHADGKKENALQDRQKEAEYTEDQECPPDDCEHECLRAPAHQLYVDRPAIYRQSRFFHRFGHRRMAMTGSRNILRRAAEFDNSHNLLNEISGIRTNNVATEDFVRLRIRQDFHEPVRIAVAPRPAIRHERKPTGFVSATCFFQFLFRFTEQRTSSQV